MWVKYALLGAVTIQRSSSTVFAVTAVLLMCYGGSTLTQAKLQGFLAALGDDVDASTLFNNPDVGFGKWRVVQESSLPE